MQIMGTGLEL